MAKKLKAKKQVEHNLNPYKDLPLKSVVTLKGIEVEVAIQNAGMTWFTPTVGEEEFSKDTPDRFLLRGLVVLQSRTDGTIRDCYNWSHR